VLYTKKLDCETVMETHFFQCTLSGHDIDVCSARRLGATDLGSDALVQLPAALVKEFQGLCNLLIVPAGGYTILCAGGGGRPALQSARVRAQRRQQPRWRSRAVSQRRSPKRRCSRWRRREAAEVTRTAAHERAGGCEL
jgi:hypothetical protein